MLRLPVVLDISYKAMYGLNFKHSFSGLSLAEGHQLVFGELNPEEFGQGLLTTFIKRHYPHNTGVYFNLPYEASFVRELSLPFTEPKKVQEVVKYELESMLPFSVDEIIFDYYSYPDHQGNKTRVIAVGSDKKNLLPYLEILRENNIKVLGIYSPLDALYHLHSHIDQDSCVMLHVSSMTTLVMIIFNREWLFSRIIPFGFDNLVYRLADKWDKSFEDSEKLFLNLPAVNINERDTRYIKEQMKISKTNAKNLMLSIDEFGTTLRGEIQLTLKSIPSQIYQQIKQKLPIIVSSDLRNQTTLEGILTKKVEQPIISFPYEKTPLAAMPRDHVLSFGGVLSQTSRGLNFLQKDLKQYVLKGKNIKKLPFYSGLAVGLLLFVLSYFIDFYNKSKALELLKDKNQKIFQQYFGNRAGTASTDLVGEAKSEVTKLKRETEIFNAFFRDKTFSEVIVSCNELFLITGFASIENITYNTKKLTLNGKAENSSLISNIKANAENSSSFDSVECTQRSSPSKSGGKQWKFRCTLNLKSNGSKGS